MAKQLKIKLLSNRFETLYSRATSTSAGLDLYADFTTVDFITIYPSETAQIPTGVAVKLPKGTAGLVCPRSGLARDEGLTVLNAPGVIDEDYTGEIKVLVHNTTRHVRQIKSGQKIAQLVIVPCIIPKIIEVTQLPNTERGDKGFGSSGK